jgi:hypothetical protein
MPAALASSVQLLYDFPRGDQTKSHCVDNGLNHT